MVARLTSGLRPKVEPYKDSLQLSMDSDAKLRFRDREKERNQVNKAFDHDPTKGGLFDR